MSSLPHTAPAVAPVTAKDVARARMFGIKLPPMDSMTAPKISDIDLGGFAGLGHLAPASLAADEESTGVPIPAVEPSPRKLAIHGFVYLVSPIDPGESGSVAYRLHKRDMNTNYDVIRDEFGVVKCDCPDYLFRHDGAGGMCKHGKALVEAGLIEAPDPVPTTLGRREIKGGVSVLVNNTPDRVYYPRVEADQCRPAARARRFEPSPDEMAEAAQLFGEIEAERRAEYRREYARVL